MTVGRLLCRLGYRAPLSACASSQLP